MSTAHKKRRKRPSLSAPLRSRSKKRDPAESYKVLRSYFSCDYRGFEYGEGMGPRAICVGGQLFDEQTRNRRENLQTPDELIPCPRCRYYDAIEYWTGFYMSWKGEPRDDAEIRAQVDIDFKSADRDRSGQPPWPLFWIRDGETMSWVPDRRRNHVPLRPGEVGISNDGSLRYQLWATPDVLRFDDDPDEWMKTPLFDITESLKLGQPAKSLEDIQLLLPGDKFWVESSFVPERWGPITRFGVSFSAFSLKPSGRMAEMEFINQPTKMLSAAVVWDLDNGAAIDTHLSFTYWLDATGKIARSVTGEMAIDNLNDWTNASDADVKRTCEISRAALIAFAGCAGAK